MIKYCGSCIWCKKDLLCTDEADVYICTCKDSDRYGMVYSEYDTHCEEWCEGEKKKNPREKPYVISKDEKSGCWYCHMRNYSYIPVFGSIGDKKKAQKVCNMYNRSCGFE